MDIKIIGKPGCGRCEMVKNLLHSKGIEYTYQLLDELESETKKQYLSEARKKGLMNMPLIIKDEQMVDLKEVM